tara:strand:- start:45 stop:284 length:240 start_codon:yes stop_codon:yes gene_type:complete
MADKKWYRVTATMSTDLYAFVEAESEDDAYEKARWHDEPDAGDYTEEENGGDWNIDDATEVTTEKEKEQLKDWLKWLGK